MQSTTRAHRFTPSLLVGYLLLGAWIVVFMVAAIWYNYFHLDPGRLAWLDYAFLTLLAPLMLGFGIYLLVVVAVTKIITSPQGLEYHTPLYVVKLEWQQFKDPVEGESNARDLINAAPAPGFPSQLQPRRWTRLLRLDVRQGAVKEGIPVHRFGGYRGRQLMAEIRRYTPHL